MGSERKVTYIKNALVLGTLIAFAYLVFYFFSGNHIGERLEGTWRAVCARDEITFSGNAFTRGSENGEFRVRANLIYFCASGRGYPIRVIANYLVLNGVCFLPVIMY